VTRVLASLEGVELKTAGMIDVSDRGPADSDYTVSQKKFNM